MSKSPCLLLKVSNLEALISGEVFVVCACLSVTKRTTMLGRWERFQACFF